jgi:hypothetical protein
MQTWKWLGSERHADMTADDYAAADELISITNQLIGVGFMPADMATADDLGWIEEFGSYAYREEADGSLTLIIQDDNTIVLASASRNAVFNREARFDMTPE